MTSAPRNKAPRRSTNGRRVAGTRICSLTGRLDHGLAEGMIAVHTSHRVVEHARVHRDDRERGNDEQQPNQPPVKHDQIVLGCWPPQHLNQRGTWLLHQRRPPSLQEAQMCRRRSFPDHERYRSRELPHSVVVVCRPWFRDKPMLQRPVSAIRPTMQYVMVEDSAWSGRLAFGPWWFLYSGPVGPTDPHAHHAFQIVLHGGSPVVADASARPIAGPIVVLCPDGTHSFRAHRDHVVVVFVDPESAAGSRLRRDRVAQPLAGAGHPVSALLGSLRPDNWSRAEEAVQRILDHLCGPSGRSTMSWWRHPSIDAALAGLSDFGDEGRVEIDQLAAEVGLSVSRLTHVFRDEIGTPIRSYVRWLRLVNATEQLANGASMTQAADKAGFTDGPHLARTFRAMFGLAPTEAVALGQWLPS